MSNTLKTLKISGGVLGLYCLTLATAPVASACEPCGTMTGGHVAPTVAPSIPTTGGIGGNTFYNGSNYTGFGGGSGGGGGRPNFNNVGGGGSFGGGRPNFTNVATGGSFGGAFGGSGGSTTFNNMSNGSGWGGGGGGYSWGGSGGGIGGGGGAGGGIGGGGGTGGGIGGGGGAGGGIGGGGTGGGIGGGGGDGGGIGGNGGGGNGGGGNGGGGNVGGNPGTAPVIVIGKSGVDASASPLSFGSGNAPSAFSGSTLSLALEFQQRLAAAQGAYESASQRLAQAGTAQPVASSGPQRYSRVPGDLADCGCLNPDLASDTRGSELAAAKVAEAEAAAELAKAKAETRQFLESVQTNNAIAGNASNFSPIW